MKAILLNVNGISFLNAFTCFFFAGKYFLGVCLVIARLVAGCQLVVCFVLGVFGNLQRIFAFYAIACVNVKFMQLLWLPNSK